MQDIAKQRERVREMAMKFSDMDELCRAWLITFAGIFAAGLIIALILQCVTIAIANAVVFVPIEIFVYFMAWVFYRANR